MRPVAHLQAIKAGVIVVATVVAMAYICMTVVTRKYSPTTIEGLTGRWSGQSGEKDLVLNIGKQGGCSLQVSSKMNNSVEYFGTCEIGRDKAPTTLTMRELPAFDFDLYTIVARVGDSKMLMAPIAKRKRARAITLDNAFVMERSHL